MTPVGEDLHAEVVLNYMQQFEKLGLAHFLFTLTFFYTYDYGQNY